MLKFMMPEMTAASKDGISIADDAAFIVNAMNTNQTNAEKKIGNGEPLRVLILDIKIQTTIFVQSLPIK